MLSCTCITPFRPELVRCTPGLQGCLEVLKLCEGLKPSCVLDTLSPCAPSADFLSHPSSEYLQSHVLLPFKPKVGQWVQKDACCTAICTYITDANSYAYYMYKVHAGSKFSYKDECCSQDSTEMLIQ